MENPKKAAMQEAEKLVDLPPHQWQSEREKPREPFFGPGLPFFICFLISIVIAVLLHNHGWMAQLSAGLIGALLGGFAQAIYDR